MSTLGAKSAAERDAVDAPARPEPDAAPRFRRAGPFVFLSGVGPASLGECDIRSQTAATIDALRAVLEELGGGLENMVEVTTYLVNMNDFAGYNDAYSRYFSPDGPARTTVAVERLSRSGQLIEMRATAYITTEASEK